MIVYLSNLRREALQVSTLTLQVGDLNSQLQQSIPGAKFKGQVALGHLIKSANSLEIMKCFLSLSLSLCRTSKESESEKCCACPKNTGAHRKKYSASKT